MLSRGAHKGNEWRKKEEKKEKKETSTLFAVLSVSLRTHGHTLHVRHSWLLSLISFIAHWLLLCLCTAWRGKRRRTNSTQNRQNERAKIPKIEKGRMKERLAVAWVVSAKWWWVVWMHTHRRPSCNIISLLSLQGFNSSGPEFNCDTVRWFKRGSSGGSGRVGGKKRHSTLASS